MNAANDRSGRTVRITVKVRPDEYDQFVCHVRNIGSNLSAFFRESAEKAMKEEDRIGLASPSSIKTDTRVHAITETNVSETSLSHQRRWAPK
jgi:hypothetical protein